MKKIILIGAIREGQTPNCGETMKNQLFIMRYKELFDKIVTVDTFNWRKRPWILIKILYIMLCNKKTGIVLSASKSIRYLINFLYYFPIHKKVYFWVVGDGLANDIDKGMYQIRALNKMKRIIVQGQSMIDDLEKRGITNAIYVPNSKPIIFHPNITPKKDNQYRFVFLSRIHPTKGIKEIAVASELLRERKIYNFSVDFYGKIASGYNEEFLSIIHAHDGLEYKGFLNMLNKDSYKKLSEYDVMLFPTYWPSEGFPGVVIDANMSGVPIIASDWNQNKNVVIHGSTGVIIPTHDIKALADSMEAFITKKIDLYQMKKKCNEYIQQYDYKTVLSESLFKNLDLL